MTDTLLWMARGLAAPGVPVVYVNPAIPGSTGSGVIVSPPEGDPAANDLIWWEGVMKATASPLMASFSEVVGPELGQASGSTVRITVPWCLEIDLSKEEGRRAAVAWADAHGGADGLTFANEPVAILAHCWKLVGDQDDDE